MKTKLLFLLFSFITLYAPYQLRAQVYGFPASSLGSAGVGTGMRVASIPKPPSDLDDAIYLSPEWEKGSILLQSGQFIKSCTLRCDLGNEYIEIKDKSIIRGIPFAEVDQFRILETSGDTVWFLGGNHYLIDEEKPDGIFELLVNGAQLLVSRTTVEILKSNGGFTDLQRGDNGIKTVRKERFYVVSDENHLYEISGMSSLVKVCGDKGVEVKNWSKENKMNPKQRNELKSIWEFYLALLDSND